MIYENLYKTFIDCPARHNINDELTVTIILKDYNNEFVDGELVTVYYDNTTIIGKGLTDSNGECSFNFTPLEWGLHTLHCNDTHISFHVYGWKNYGYANNNSKYCEDLVSVYYSGNVSVKNNERVPLMVSVPRDCYPSSPCVQVLYWGSDVRFYVNDTDGKLYLQDYRGNSWNPHVYQLICYPKRTVTR